MPVGFTRSLQIPKPSLAPPSPPDTCTRRRQHSRNGYLLQGRAQSPTWARGRWRQGRRGHDLGRAARSGRGRAKDAGRASGRAKGHRLSRTSKEGGGHGREGRERGRRRGPKASEEGSGGRRRRRDEAWAGGEGGGGNRNGETATGRSLPAGPLSLSLALAPPPPHARQTPVRHTCPTARASCPCTCDLGARPKPAHPSRTCPHLPSDPGPRSTSQVPLRNLLGREGPPQALRMGVPGPGGRGAAGVLKVVPA